MYAIIRWLVSLPEFVPFDSAQDMLRQAQDERYLRRGETDPLVVSLSNHERMHRYFFSTFHMRLIGATITPLRFVR
jgi:hypothetical protein